MAVKVAERTSGTVVRRTTTSNAVKAETYSSRRWPSSTVAETSSLQSSASQVHTPSPMRPPSERRARPEGWTAVPRTSSAATTTSETRAPQAQAVGK